MNKKLFTFLLLLLTALGWGQEDKQKQLEQQKARILKEIKAFENLLQQEKKKERSVITEISDKNAKIRLSQKLINTTQKQTKLLSDDIYRNQLQINKLNSELKVLKEDYAEMLVKSYKSRSEHSRIMFILSSENFLQAYQRMQLMKQYASFRKIQGDEIKAKKQELEDLNAKLNGQKKEKEKLLAENQKQKQALEQEKREQEKLMKLIKKDQKKYLADIKKKQKQTKEIDRQIDKLLKEAIAAANRKTAAAAGTKTTAASSTKIVLTKEGQIVSNNFKANKGKLNWPVDKGYISLGFGEQRSPIDRSVVINNRGVEITTEAGASARAVFPGEVTQVQLIPGGQKAVYVQHGDFFTIYYNLSSVNVKAGDKVSLKQDIGKLHTNPATGKTVLKFLIAQNTTILNPQTWLAN